MALLWRWEAAWPSLGLDLTTGSQPLRETNDYDQPERLGRRGHDIPQDNCWDLGRSAGSPERLALVTVGRSPTWPPESSPKGRRHNVTRRAT